MHIQKYLVRVYGVMYTPHAKHDSCNPARRLTWSEFKPCYATFIRRETQALQKEVSQKMSLHMSSTDFLAFIVHCNHFLTYKIPRTFRVQGSSHKKKKKKNSSRECKRLETIERLKGHSQLRDCADLDTTFVSLKSVYLNPKSNVRVGNEHVHQLTVSL